MIYAVPPSDEILESLPEKPGASSIGKEFVFSVPPCYEDASGTPNFVKIVAAPIEKASITLEVAADGFKQTKIAEAGSLVEFRLNSEIAQPYRKIGFDPPLPNYVYDDKAIKISSESLMSVFVVVEYKAVSDAFLALPVSSLGSEYTISSYPQEPGEMGYSAVSLICAAFDGTEVEFRLGGNQTTELAGGIKTGTVIRKTLNAGDVWALSGDGAYSDLSGSNVSASKPIAVLSGNERVSVPIQLRDDDYIASMHAGEESWGAIYPVPPVPNRRYSPIVRVYAKENDTKIYRNSEEIAFLPKNEGIYDESFVEFRAAPDFEGAAPSVVRADKRFGASMYNTGKSEDAKPYLRSSPFMCDLVPYEQYQNSLYLTNYGRSLGYDENYVALIYECRQNGQPAGELEFGYFEDGNFQLKPIVDEFDFNDVRKFSETIDGKLYAVKYLSLLREGLYKFVSDSPIQAYRFGFSQTSSFGFPACAGLTNLEKDDDEPPIPVWEAKCDGDVVGATVCDMPPDAESRSNLSIIVSHSRDSENYIFSHDPFQPGIDSCVGWDLRVMEKSLDAKATLTFSDRNGNDTTIAFEYFAPNFEIRPRTIDFGVVKKVLKVEKDFWVVNTSSKILTVNDVFLRFYLDQFDVDRTKLPVEIAPGDSVEFTVFFNADSTGKFQDEIRVDDGCVELIKGTVKGEVARPTIESPDIGFGAVAPGDKAEREAEIINVGAVELKVTDLRNKSGFFDIILEDQVDENNPLIIEPFRKYVFTVKFTPTDVGNYSDTITIDSDAGYYKDNICVLTGESPFPGIIASSFDWGRKRIDRQDYPAGPYTGEIEIKNNGTNAFRIAKIEVVDPVHPEAFTFDYASLLGKKIDPEKNLTMSVAFRPEDVGIFRSELVFTTEDGSKANAVLSGVGVAPLIETSNCEFDPSVVNFEGDAKIGKITIKNREWEFADSLTIFGLESTPADAISFDWARFGDYGFKLDGSEFIGDPIVLYPGESIEIDAGFAAKIPGFLEAKASIVSDALEHAEIEFSGFGSEEELAIESNVPETCFGSKDTIYLKISNLGSEDVTIYSIEFEDAASEFFFAEPDKTMDFVVKAGSEETVSIVFEPGFPENRAHEARIAVNNSSLTSPIVESDIIAESKIYEIAGAVRLADENILPTAGEYAEFELALDSEVNPTELGIRNLSVLVRYNGGFLKALPESVEVGSDLSGKFELIEDPIQREIPGELSFSLKALSSHSLDFTSGVIAKFSTAVYLPTGKDSVDESEIFATISCGSTCAVFEIEAERLRPAPTCAYGIRKVAFGSENFGFDGVKPNPAYGTAFISFSVGYDAETKIEVFNSSGEIVSIPLDGNLNAGIYEIPVDLIDLASGVYFVKLTSGHFVKVERFTVVK